MSGPIGSFARSLRGFQRPVYLVAGARFVNTFGSGVVYPFATLYFVDEVGIAFTLVGIGLLLNNVDTALGTLVGGYLADRYGRKPVMVASMALSAPALAAYALVTTAPGFIVVAGLAGLATGLFAPASQATVADATGSDRRDRAYGLLKVASNTGFGSGFVAGGLLFGLAHTAVFVVDGATSALVAALLLLALPRTLGREGGAGGGPERSGVPATAGGPDTDEGPAAGTDPDPGGDPGAGGHPDGSTGARRDAPAGIGDTLREWGRAVGHPTILALAALNLGFAVMYAQMQSTVPVFAENRLGLTSAQLGTLYVLNPLVIVVFQLPVVDRIQSWRRTRGLALSAAFWASSFLALLFVFEAPWLAGVALVGAFLVLRTVGEILHSPLVTALASEVGPAADRGSQLSVIEVTKRLGFGIGPVIGGVFFDLGLVAALWGVLIVGCGVLAAGLFALERRIPAAINGRAVAGE